jgi:AmmeMemoRadiSam system protein A
LENINSKKDFGDFTVEQLRMLMRLAKESVEAAVNGKYLEHVPPDDLKLVQAGAAFVTLKKNGDLRGCIGHVLARIPLYKCVSEMARAAAVNDSRFSPVSPVDLKDLSYEISILTKPLPVKPEDVRVGIDGLIITRAPYTGLLLPQVPVEWGWDREQFLTQTCRKAGLSGDCWKSEDARIEAFQAIVFGEDDL